MTSKLYCLLLLFVLLVATAHSGSAATIVTQGCGSIGVSAQGQPGPPFPPFTPSLSATLIGCPAFTIPAGSTLSDVSLQFKNDWQLGAPGVDTLVFSYAITGFNIPSMVATVTGSGLTGSMPPAGAIPLACTVIGEFISCDDPISATGSFNAIGITVNGIWAMGGLDFNGGEGTTVTETLTFDTTRSGGQAPEPGTLVMGGSALFGLALVWKRRRRA